MRFWSRSINDYQGVTLGPRVQLVIVRIGKRVRRVGYEMKLYVDDDISNGAVEEIPKSTL
jgi:hypothetical protein